MTSLGHRLINDQDPRASVPFQVPVEHFPWLHLLVTSRHFSFAQAPWTVWKYSAWDVLECLLIVPDWAGANWRLPVIVWCVFAEAKHCKVFTLHIVYWSCCRVLRDVRPNRIQWSLLGEHLWQFGKSPKTRLQYNITAVNLNVVTDPSFLSTTASFQNAQEIASSSSAAPWWTARRPVRARCPVCTAAHTTRRCPRVVLMCACHRALANRAWLLWSVAAATQRYIHLFPP